MIYDHVIFSSSRFAIQPGEDDETNPGIYGLALAEWLVERLDGHGVPVIGMKAEDFGRCVILNSWPYRLWVACASLDGSTSRWQMFIALEFSPILKWFVRIEPERALDQLRKEFRAVVAEIPDARDVEWQVH